MNNTAKVFTQDIYDQLAEASEVSQSPMMDFHEVEIRKVGENKYLFGTLVDDHSPENPLKAWDGMGHVFTSRRFDDTNSDMQEALGLDRDWEKDLDLVDVHPRVVRPIWIEAAVKDADFHEWCNENGRPPNDIARLDAYYRRKAEQFWRETGGLEPGGYSMDPDIFDFAFTEDVREKAWVSMFDAGLIGNPDRVMLDVYEHSGVAWSVSGEGLQCRWDTSGGAGVWVPDESLLSELDRRAPFYAFGEITGKQSGFLGNPTKPYFFELDSEFGAIRSIRYKHWHEAFEALQAFLLEQKLRLPRKKAEAQALLRKGRRRAAEEICRGVLSTYNDYLNGNVFCTAVETMVVNEDGSIEVVDTDYCGGYFGDDEAICALRETVEGCAAFLNQNENEQ